MVNLPSVVTGLIAVLVGVQMVMEALPDATAAWALDLFAFIPARTTFFFAPHVVLSALAAAPDEATEAALLGARQAGALWTFVTYALLHANWTHVGVNCVTLAAFGAPVARRMGDRRFIAFFFVCAVAGALAHLLVHPVGFAPVVGASAGISGVMGAIARFAFAPGAPLGAPSVEEDYTRPGRMSESGRRALIFVATWFGVNLLFGVFPQAAGAPGVIAWEAHLGGFVAGLLLFRAFDPER